MLVLGLSASMAFTTPSVKENNVVNIEQYQKCGYVSYMWYRWDGYGYRYYIQFTDGYYYQVAYYTYTNCWVGKYQCLTIY